MKEKFKKFWTLTKRQNAGFTLVELIVVIAILAILAGVAVPAYNGYIKKAQEAKDQLLIAAVNEAFTSGCLEAGVEVSTVTDAKISVSEQMVFGISSVTTDAEVTAAVLDQISKTFNLLFEGNFNTPFVTENVMSLDWVPEESSFVMDHENSVASRIMLSSGKFITVSAEDMAAIQGSAYADMGYAEVAAIINNLGDSSESLVSIAQKLGMGSKFSAVVYANGLVASTSEADKMDAGTMANGLQMVTAKYLAGASEEKIANLLDVDVGGSLGTTVGMLQNIADGSGGTVTVSAAALQYALVEAFANSSAADGTTISYKKTETTSSFPFVKEVTYSYDSVSEFLASDHATEDPIWALNQVQATDGYSTYTTTDQYQSDINGFVGTMSILGDNIGTVTNPGAIDIESYFKDGIDGQDAEDALTAVLGN